MNFKEYYTTYDASYFETIVEAIVKKRIGPVDSSLVEPETGKPWRANNKKKELENTISKLKVPKDKIWASFSDYQRLGIYYNAKNGQTPLGLYAYPIDYVLEKGLKVPYGYSRKYILIFEMVSDNVVSMKRGQMEVSNLDSINKNIREEKDFLKKNFKKVFSKKIDFLKKFVRSNLRNAPVILALIEDSLGDLHSNIYYDSLQGGYFGIKEKLKLLDIPEKSEILKEIKKFVDNMIIKRYGSSNGPTQFVNIGKLDEEKLRIYLSSGAIQIIKSAGDEDKQSLIKLYGLNWNEENEEESFFNFNIDKIMSLANFSGADGNIRIGTPYIEDRSKMATQTEFLKNPEIFDKALMISKKIKKSLEKSLDEFNSQKGKYLKDIHFPLDHKIKQLCDKYKIDWLEVLAKTVEEMSRRGLSTISGAFVYQITKIMSQEVTDKDDSSIRQWALWTKILRELGIDGVIDTEGTSTIHSGEPTQGAFFNPRQFKLLKVLQNNKFNPIDLSQSWQHPKQTRNQKRKSGEPLDWDIEDTPANRFLKGIKKGFSELVGNYRDSIRYEGESPLSSMKLLTKFQILFDSFMKQRDNPDSDQDLKNAIEQEIKRVSSTLLANKTNIEKLLIPKIGAVVRLIKPFQNYDYGKVLEKVDSDRYLIMFCDRYGNGYSYDNKGNLVEPISGTVQDDELQTNSSGLSLEQLRKIIEHHSYVIGYLIKIGMFPYTPDIPPNAEFLKPSQLRMTTHTQHKKPKPPKKPSEAVPLNPDGSKMFDPDIL